MQVNGGDKSCCRWLEVMRESVRQSSGQKIVRVKVTGVYSYKT